MVWRLIDYSMAPFTEDFLLEKHTGAIDQIVTMVILTRMDITSWDLFVSRQCADAGADG